MKIPTSIALFLLSGLLAAAADPAAPAISRQERGMPDVTVTSSGDTWTIAGRHQTVTLDAKTLALHVQAGPTAWDMVASTPTDMQIKAGAQEFFVRLADAGKIAVEPYDTGFKTGVKLTLSGWRRPGADAAAAPLDLTLYLTICLEGANEELVFDTMAKESCDAAVHQLDWPTALDAGTVDYTVLSNNRGNLLPRNWPKPYFPIRGDAKFPNDHSVMQSHVVESWSMSWWGFEKGRSAMMVIIETPDDAAYQFSHPAGGPTVIGPRWRETLGRFGYLRTARMCFFDQGNYVTLAKRYRSYVMDTGLFVSLREKIARTPILASLIGTPQTRISILHNMNPESDRYDPAAHYSLFTFDERAKQLRDLKAGGIDHALVFISGWANLGYDRQHPDPLPPAPAAGGWEGLKRLADTCRDLGYPFIFHDQYRDYYLDAPSFNKQFAIHEEDASLPATIFPGSRFGDAKDGTIPLMWHWDGGRQSYLNARFQPGHLRKNYQLFFQHGIHPQGIYIDVIGYVPPDEDFNPEHPTTRSDAMRGEAELLNWSRANLGFTATEAGSDWVVPYADCVNQSGGNGKCIPVPLYQLVYHDAILISYGASREDGDNGLLMGLLCGGMPELPIVPGQGPNAAKNLALVKEMAALHKRVALLEMTNHEFLDADRTKERTTFADGTTVTVDWTIGIATVSPELPAEK
ncbi:MAG TPA: DUF5696 domain-containing protein [Opitutaceae bacterium]|nr:DUF5696 domain-containing protein [Opitutaceae bacterium]